MKFLLLTLQLLIFTITTVFGQTDTPCTDFYCSYKKSVALWKQRDYQKALDNLDIAEKHLTEIDIREKTGVRDFRILLTALMGKMNFYNNSWDFFYDKSVKKYGFVDRNLKTRIDFIYDEAKHFGEYFSGYAEVKRNSITFLIDTIGQEYKLANSLNQLDTTIKALVVTDAKFDKLPPSVYQQKQLNVLCLYEPLRQLSGEVGNLTNLKYLSFGLTEATNLPTELAI